jgi:pyruvate,water dikinase
MGCYVLGFQEIDQTQVAVVGGKGAHLGELSRIEGLRVPAGFCVTTDAFQRIMAEAPSIDDRLDPLSRLKPDDREAIRAVSAEIRRTLEGIAIPDDLAAAITRALAWHGEQAAYAVRSSATAEDLPTASFAGQQDTYLNVVGSAAILQHVSRCWASLFTERAVTYRMRNGFDHRKVHMAVVVQQMVFPQASGILFTADPVTGNRKVASVEASFGLGEALVSGLVNADVYKVRDGVVVAKAVATKQRAIHASPAGGTQEHAIEPERQKQPALSDAQVVRLAQLGRRIEAHFGRPQDIEWCLVDDDFQIVQSRPISTLFPIPAAGDRKNHLYVSVGHQQMMIDPMKPLGLSFWQMTTPRPMAEAGGRLFVDVTQILASPASRAALLELAGKSDPLIGDALQTILDRGDFIPSRRGCLDRDRSGHRHRADRAQPSFHSRLEARHPDEVRTVAARFHPGGHPGAEADLVRSSEPSGGDGGDGGHLVAQRAVAGVAGREERSRHAHAVRPPQRHVGDGSGAPGRRGRDPLASGRGGFSAARRGRELPRRVTQARGGPGSARRNRGLAGQVRHALRRRD